MGAAYRGMCGSGAMARPVCRRSSTSVPKEAPMTRTPKASARGWLRFGGRRSTRNRVLHVNYRDLSAIGHALVSGLRLGGGLSQSLCKWCGLDCPALVVSGGKDHIDVF